MRSLLPGLLVLTCVALSGSLPTVLFLALLAICGNKRPVTVVRNSELAWKIHDFRNTEGLAMVQIRCSRGFETKNEAFT
jgi:hypothetical protein